MNSIQYIKKTFPFKGAIGPQQFLLNYAVLSLLHVLILGGAYIKLEHWEIFALLPSGQPYYTNTLGWGLFFTSPLLIPSLVARLRSINILATYPYFLWMIITALSICGTYTTVSAIHEEVTGNIAHIFLEAQLTPYIIVGLITALMIPMHILALVLPAQKPIDEHFPQKWNYSLQMGVTAFMAALLFFTFEGFTTLSHKNEHIEKSRTDGKISNLFFPAEVIKKRAIAEYYIQTGQKPQTIDDLLQTKGEKGRSFFSLDYWSTYDSSELFAQGGIYQNVKQKLTTAAFDGTNSVSPCTELNKNGCEYWVYLAPLEKDLQNFIAKNIGCNPEGLWPGKCKLFAYKEGAIYHIGYKVRLPKHWTPYDWQLMLDVP